MGEKGTFMQVPTQVAAATAPLDVARMLRVLWHERWLVALTIAASLGLGGYLALHVAVPVYASTVTLRLDTDTPDLRDVPGLWPAPATDEISLNTRAAELTSDAVLRQVVVRGDLLDDPEFNRYLLPVNPLSRDQLRRSLRHFLAGTRETRPDDAAVMDKTVRNLRAVLDAQPVPETTLISLTARSRDPARAAHIADLVAQTYLDGQIVQRDAKALADIAWLEDRLADLRRRIDSGPPAEQQTLTALYAAFDSRLQAARLVGGLDMADSRIIAPATSGEFIGPRRTLIVQVAVALGAALALALVVARYFARRGVLHPAMLLPARVAVTSDNSPSQDQTAEAWRQLALASAGTAPKVILLCHAALPASEVSPRAIAMSLAQEGDQVVTLGGDPSAANTLSDKDFASLKTLKTAIAARQPDEGRLLIAAPPVLTSSQTQMLLATADACIIVARWAVTPRMAVMDALAMTGGVPAIVLLTDADRRKMRRFADLYPAPTVSLPSALPRPATT